MLGGILGMFGAAIVQAGPVYTMSAGRIGAIIGTAIGLIGAIAGRRALGQGDRRRAIMALMLGPVGAVIGAVVVATAKGGLGTGNGLGGGVVAVTVGVIAMALGGMALARARRAG
jgi:uncharacterized protein DUF6223